MARYKRQAINKMLTMRNDKEQVILPNLTIAVIIYPISLSCKYCQVI